MTCVWFLSLISKIDFDFSQMIHRFTSSQNSLPTLSGAMELNGFTSDDWAIIQPLVSSLISRLISRACFWDRRKVIKSDVFSAWNWGNMWTSWKSLLMILMSAIQFGVRCPVSISFPFLSCYRLLPWKTSWYRCDLCEVRSPWRQLNFWSVPESDAMYPVIPWSDIMSCLFLMTGNKAMWQYLDILQIHQIHDYVRYLYIMIWPRWHAFSSQQRQRCHLN